MGAHAGVHCDALHERPMPQLVPQPPQFWASLVTSTHAPLHSTWVPEHVGVTHWLPLHTCPPVQSPSTQHWKHPFGQHFVPAPQLVCTQLPALHVSVVQAFGSLQSALPQHS
jgi:hypothetical protein